MKNGLNSIKILYTGSHKSFPMLYGLWGGIFKACFSIIIFHIYKCNEINKFYLDVQKHVSYTGSHKRFDILLVMAGNGYKCIFNRVPWF